MKAVRYCVDASKLTQGNGDVTDVQRTGNNSGYTLTLTEIEERDCD